MERIQDRKSKTDPGCGVDDHLQEHRDRWVADRAEQERRWNPRVQEQENVTARVAARIPGGDGLGSDPRPQVGGQVGEEQNPRSREAQDARCPALDPRPERTSWLHRSRVEESIPTGTNRLRNRRVPPENGG